MSSGCSHCSEGSEITTLSVIKQTRVETGLSLPKAVKDLMTLVPYKRIGEPDDIARAAVWLV
jgi:NAD(P)-dependent dehydrogenase (short-subunit alcohol dehydrogenase family)